jgi:hypothetical protein
LVILSEPLPHFSGTKAHYWIEIGIVIGRSMKDLDPKGALFQVVVVSLKSLFHDISQQLRIPFTGSEPTVTHNLFELRLHKLLFAFCLGVPSTRK